MAKDKKSFLIYCDIIKTIDHLTNEEKGILFQHLLEYVNDMNPVLEDRLLLTAWKPIQLQLKRDLVKYEETRAKNSANARKRWDNNNATAYDRTNRNANHADNDTDTDNDTDIGKVKKKDIEERKSEFYQTLTPYLETYSKVMVREFYEYWSEHGDNDKKMRFEKEKSFSISRRLGTWHKNESKFGNKDSSTLEINTFKG